MKNLFSLLIFFCLIAKLSAQDTPNCNASSLQLKSLDFGFTGVTADLIFTAEEEVISYDVQHDFIESGEPMTEIISSEVPSISLSFTPDGVHTFTALNRCSDGSTHTGSTFSIDFGQEGVDEVCPAPTNLVIDMFDPGFVLFRWDDADSVDFWQVSYEPEGLIIQNFTVEEPLVEQVLEPTVRHTFSLYAVCDDEMFSPSLTQTFSPTVRFSLIIIEDIKLLPISCDSLTILTWPAYQMECTEHGDFGPNKEAYVYTHGCEDCTTATNSAQAEARLCWNVYPNPNAGQMQVEYCLEQSSWVHFEMYNLLGSLVWRSPTHLAPAGANQYIPISMEILPPGTYWLMAQLGERRRLEKVIVQ